MSKSYIEQSKIQWERADGGQADREQLQLGCMQRIANATELMAKNHALLVSDRDYYKRRYDERTAALDKAIRSNNALRGHMKRLKARTL